jgi:hypothetical protein
MTVRRIGTASAVLVFIVAVLVGRATGSASPSPSSQRGLTAQQASPPAGTPGAQRLASPVATSRAASPTPSFAVDIPSPFECRVDGITWVDLVGLVDEISDEADGRPDPSRLDRDDIRGGQQVSPEDFQGILATTREVVACVNAEEPFKVAALLSDRFLARLALDLLSGEGGITELLEQLPALSQEVDPEQDLAMIPITAAWYPDLPDKTIFAILEPNVEGLEEQRSFLVVFTYEKHRWLIDAMVLVE